MPLSPLRTTGFSVALALGVVASHVYAVGGAADLPSDSVLALATGESDDIPDASGAVEAISAPVPSGGGTQFVALRDGELPTPIVLERCRKASWLVIPGVFVLPETGPGIALKARVRDLLGIGYVDVTTIATWKKQADLEMVWLRDSIGGAWRTRQRLEIGRFPSIWYGEGNPPPDSFKARYEPTYVIAETRLARYVLD